MVLLLIAESCHVRKFWKTFLSFVVLSMVISTWWINIR